MNRINDIKLHYNDYLTEYKLIDLFKQLKKYSNFEYEVNKKILNSRYRANLIIITKNNKYLIEFDGYKHFQDAITICRDIKKDNLWIEYYKTNPIRIPYFMQLNTGIFISLFEQLLKDINIDVDNLIVQTDYKHGFWDKKALLPASFCSLGIKKFEEYLFYFKKVEDNYWNDFHEQILISLYLKIKENKLDKNSILYLEAFDLFNSFFVYCEGFSKKIKKA